MASTQTTGIIDIGSNTVRLAVYQILQGGAHRVVDQGRWPARLSERLTEDGRLPKDAVEELSEVLLHFKRICGKHGARKIRAVATAAIRQSANRQQVLRSIAERTGLRVELLSGEDEARLGSLAALRTMDFSDGYLIDIGGGSTEISLILGRRPAASVSFPFGCVNAKGRYAIGNGPVEPSRIADVQAEIRRQLQAAPWIAEHPGLPLIGLGGTVRALAKMSQRWNDYPLPILHGYELTAGAIRDALNRLAPLSAEKRKKVPGLSKDRADVIVPGLAILGAAAEHCGASRLMVCGAGLRDGLFFETCLPAPADGRIQVLEESIRNLTALYPTAPIGHLHQVRRLALALYARLTEGREPDEETVRLLGAAAVLYRIGAAIDSSDSADPTFYLLTHARWNGLTHREIVLIAAIASYRGTGSLRRKLSPYRALLREGDADRAARLGAVVQLAAALDRSESQAIGDLRVQARGGRLELTASAAHPLPVERMEVESLSKAFKKAWGLAPTLKVR